MPGSRDLLTLMYRADWTRWSLSAVVSVQRDGEVSERLTDRAIADLRRESGGVWPPVAPRPHRPSRAEVRQRLVIAPGGRYRVEPIDDEPRDDEPRAGEPRGDESRSEAVRLIVCDGESCWVIRGAGENAEADRYDADPARTPMPDVVAPTWLLSRFRLTAQGLTQVGGRAAYRVLAIPRLPADRMLARFDALFDRLELLVDAELGVVLRRAAVFDGRPVGIVELRDVTVDPPAAADPATFRPPPGITVNDSGTYPADFDASLDSDPSSDGYFAGAGGVAASLAMSAAAAAAGIAARRLARPEPPRNTWPDPESAMPGGDPLPGAVPADGRPSATGPAGRRPTGASDPDQREAIPGDLLNLIARTDLPALNLTAQAHSWLDVPVLMTSNGPGSAGSGSRPLLGPGFLGIGGLRTGFRRSHRAALLRVAMPDRYRITYQIDDRPTQPLTVACDGELLRKVFHNRVVTSPAQPLPPDFVGLLDPAWLLVGWRLTAADEQAVGGRPAFRVTAEPPPPRASGPAGRPADPSLRIAAVVDAELGILLRLVLYVGEQPAARFELRDVIIHDARQRSPGQPPDAGELAAFTVDIPPGARVIASDGAPLHDLDLPSPAKVAGTAAAALLDGAASAIGWLSGRTRRVIAHDDSAAPAPGQVPPGEIDQGGDPVAVAEQGDQVQRQPGQPGDRAADPDPARQLDHG